MWTPSKEGHLLGRNGFSIPEWQPFCEHLTFLIRTRGGCARVIECNRSSSAHHRVCTFFPTLFNLVGKGSGHAQTERQSPDGNKHPRGTPTFLTAGKAKDRVPLHEVAHRGEQLHSQKPDGHAHTKNAITLRACTTSSDYIVVVLW